MWIFLVELIHSLRFSSEASSQMLPTNPPTTAQKLIEQNNRKRIDARKEFLENSSSKDVRTRSDLDSGRRRFNKDSGQTSDVVPRDVAGVVGGDIFSRRRKSSPFAFNNVVTASLRIPVQMTSSSNNDDIPYIEDSSNFVEECYSPSLPSGGFDNKFSFVVFTNFVHSRIYEQKKHRWSLVANTGL